MREFGGEGASVGWVHRDGRRWPVGTAADVGWIAETTSCGLEITAAIPPVFDSYATVVAADTPLEQQGHDHAVLAVLRRYAFEQRWWLGYLDTGSADIVFPEAPKVTLYAGWSYVVVQAGAEQAARWRGADFYPWRPSRLPDLIVPTDHSWLLCTLWDDDWTCVGGPQALIDAFVHHPDLAGSVRQVTRDQDATPPGHRAI